MESYEYELYEFWDDLEYAEDEYWDYGIGHPPRDQHSDQTGSKRKRRTATPTHPNKRRTTSGAKPGMQDNLGSSHYPVYFMSVQERLRIAGTRPPILQASKPVTFFADWRERYPADQDVSVKEMPRDMKHAAEAQEDDALREEHGVRADKTSDQGDEDEDEDEIDAHDDVLTSLDPDTLKRVLRQRMAEAGLEGVDEGELMATISKMLGGGDGSDEASGQLANSLLEQAAEGGETGFTGWLSQQGVALENDGEDTASVTTEELTKGAGQSISSHHALHDSAQDSAISVQESTTLRSRQRITSTEKKLAFGVPPDGEVESSNQPHHPVSKPPGTHAPLTKSTPSTDADKRRAPSSRDAPTVGGPAKPGLSRKRKAPAAEPEDAAPTPAAPKPSKEPATKRTRSSRTRPGA